MTDPERSAQQLRELLAVMDNTGRERWDWFVEVLRGLTLNDRITAVNELIQFNEDIGVEIFRIRRQAIRELREQGASYEHIAHLLGVSKSRAQQLSRSVIDSDEDQGSG